MGARVSVLGVILLLLFSASPCLAQTAERSDADLAFDELFEDLDDELDFEEELVPESESAAESAPPEAHPSEEAVPRDANAPSHRVIDSGDASALSPEAPETPEGSDAIDEALTLPPTSPGKGPSSGIEEIVITTTGRPIDVQDAPTSAMVFSADDLVSARVTDVRDLAEYTPNLEIKTGGAASNATLFIRGIGLNDFNANASSSVAVFNDDVYVNSPAGQLFQLFDVQGVEILRGPQGTLYGRNVTAGAIRIMSRMPTNDYEGYVTSTYGNYDAVEVEGALGGPILEDALLFRVAGRMQLRDGITKNRCAGGAAPGAISAALEGRCARQVGGLNPPIPNGLPKWVNEVDAWAARAIARIVPAEDLEVTLNFHGGQNRGDARQNQSRGTEPPLGNLDARIRRNAGFFRDTDDDPFAGAYDVVSNENIDLLGGSVRIEWEFEDVRLTSITAYEQNERSFLDNSDASPSYLITSTIDDQARQWSEDLRLDSHLGDAFEWNAGATFITETAEVDNIYRVAGVGLAFVPRQQYEQRFYHAAVYGYLSYQVTEELRFEGGGRVGWEEKSFDINAFRFLASNPSITRDALQGDDSKRWFPVTGDLVINWSPTEDINLYAKYSRGWKTGHFNGGALNASQLIEPVDPETVNAFEVGVKSSWFDGALILNAAVYYYDYEDYQVFALQNQPDSIPLPRLINAQDVESRGFEIEMRTRPTDALYWNLAIGWQEARFGTFTTTVVRSTQSINLCGGQSPCLVFDNDDFSGNQLPAAPDLNVSTSVEYEIDMGSYGVLLPRVDANYKSKIYFDHQGDDALAEDPYWLLHARLTYRLPGDKISLAFWVRNLTDQAYLQQAFDAREVADTILDVYGDPRTFGVTLTLEY
jgi:iron complex outermembrane receptor protein